MRQRTLQRNFGARTVLLAVLCCATTFLSAQAGNYDQQLQSAIALFQQNQFAEAAQAAGALTTADPNRWEGYSLAAQVAEAQHRTNDAEAAYQRALAVAPQPVKPKIQQAMQQIETQSIERHIRANFQLPLKVGVKVESRKPSEFPNYDEVTVGIVPEGGQKQEHKFLFAKDGKRLVQWVDIDMTKDPYADVMAKIDLDHRPWRGKADAKVVIVSFDDLQCPFCARMHQELFGGIYKNYADRVKIVYKDFPLAEIHPWAKRAAIDGNCLAAQNNDAYWSFVDYFHANPQIGGNPVDALDQAARDTAGKFSLDMNRLNACINAQDDSQVRASLAEGEGLGVQGTPILFINGYKINGLVSEEELRAAIDSALRDAGEAAPPTAATR